MSEQEVFAVVAGCLGMLTFAILALGIMATLAWASSLFSKLLAEEHDSDNWYRRYDIEHPGDRIFTQRNHEQEPAFVNGADWDGNKTDSLGGQAK